MTREYPAAYGDHVVVLSGRYRKDTGTIVHRTWPLRRLVIRFDRGRIQGRRNKVKWTAKVRQHQVIPTAAANVRFTRGAGPRR